MIKCIHFLEDTFAVPIVGEHHVVHLKDGHVGSISGGTLSWDIAMHHTTHENYEANYTMRYTHHEVAIKGIRILLS